MIKKNTLLFGFILLLNAAPAQTGLNEMINAEKSFAAFSIAHSTKEAFLQYTDSTSIMFDNGKAVKAHDYWKVREKNTSVLEWRPNRAEVSLTGDFGYTTGPWTFRPSATDSILARGYFATVWYRTTDGEWKFLVDLGVDNLPADADTIFTKLNPPKQSDSRTAIAHIFPMIAAENEYVRTWTKNKKKGREQFLSSESILLRNKHQPAVTEADQKKLVNDTPSAIQYKMEGWNVSAGTDLGYVYGSATVNGKTESFFRIWRCEKTGWKIALEIVRY
ncbi:MAG: hypothetical protein NTW29_11210 [Bacteroidetes bacterium]|nr:hypothetical protein [Bacteroidota bacterium]